MGGHNRSKKNNAKLLSAAKVITCTKQFLGDFKITLQILILFIIKLLICLLL